MDSPRPAGAARPPMVTAAAVLLIIAGALGVLFSLLLFSVGGVYVLIAAISLIIAALEIYAGVNVLGLREIGRRIGLVVAGVAILVQLLQITRNPVPAIIGIAINGFVVYALTQHANEFQS